MQYSNVQTKKELIQFDNPITFWYHQPMGNDEIFPKPINKLGGVDQFQINALQVIRNHGGKAIILAIPLFYQLFDASIAAAVTPTKTPTPNRTATAVGTAIAEFYRAQTVKTPTVTPISTFPAATPDANQMLGDIGVISCISSLFLGAIFLYFRFRQPGDNLAHSENQRSLTANDFSIPYFQEYLTYTQKHGPIAGKALDIINQTGLRDVATYYSGWANIQEHLDAFHKSGQRQTFNHFINFFNQRLAGTPRYIHDRDVAGLKTSISEVENLAKQGIYTAEEAQRRVGELRKRVIMAENKISLLSILMPNRNRPPDSNSHPLLPSGQSDNK